MENETSLLKNISTHDIFADPNQFLDGVLAHLLRETQTEHPLPKEVIFMNRGQSLSNRDAHIVMQKLVNDGYVAIIQDKLWYYITFDGAKFIKEGGYISAYRKEKRKKIAKNVKDYLLIFGSFVAGFGSVGLLYFEYVKHSSMFCF